MSVRKKISKIICYWPTTIWIFEYIWSIRWIKWNQKLKTNLFLLITFKVVEFTFTHGRPWFTQQKIFWVLVFSISLIQRIDHRSQILQEEFFVDTRYFCIIGRCIIQSCESNDDCPGGDEGQCIEETCITITICSDDSDCGGFLICGKSESEEDGICTPKEEPPPECIESSECPPVSNLTFSSYPFPLFPFHFPSFPFSPAFFFLAPFCHEHFHFL